LERVEMLQHPRLTDVDTPKGSLPPDPLEDPPWSNFSFTIKTSRGPQTISGELLHSAATTYLSPNDELLGTDFEIVSTPEQARASQLAESPTRYNWDGVKGLGVLERIARIDTFRRD